MWEFHCAGALSALTYMHNRELMHCDLKPANMVIRQDILQLCDFGLATFLCNKQPLDDEVLKKHGVRLVTLHYRAVELLLGDMDYGLPIDIWSMGCVVAEMLLKEQLFSGATVTSMLQSIFGCLGLPSGVDGCDMQYIAGLPRYTSACIKCKDASAEVFATRMLRAVGPGVHEWLRLLLAFRMRQRLTAASALAMLTRTLGITFPTRCGY